MWILLVALTQAGERDCLSCCDSAGVADCETTLRVYGPESKQGRERGGVRVDGLYVLGCDGRGWFDNSRVAYLMDPPVDGELAMPESDPRAVECFARSCALPRDLTLITAADGSRQLRTPSGVAPTAMEYRRAPTAVAVAATTVRPSGAATAVPATSAAAAVVPASSTAPTAAQTTVTGSAATVVVIEGRTIYAQRAPTPPVAAASPPVAVASPPVAVASPPVAVASPPVVVASPSVVGSAASAEPAVRIQPPAMSGGASSAPAVSASPADPFGGALPADPPAECYASEGARGVEARAQVMSGDDKRVAGDSAGAVAAYRAAVSLDPCSAYGWLGMGQSALALSRPDIAVRALRNTTRLMPTHYGAWSDLGRAYEAIGQPTLAHDAYEEALERQPNLPEANAGWRRTMK